MSGAVALVTNAEMNSLAQDDALLVPALARLGISSVVVGWDNPRVDWKQFGLVVVRSCWNYHLQPLAFLQWLDALERMPVPVLNTVNLLKRNLSKTYLFDLARLGLSIPPTIFVDAQDSRTLADILAQERWPEAVIKPSISASAYATARVTLRSASQQEDAFLQLRKQRGVLVQQFLPAVVERGELSFIFLGGRYSHAVLKTARPGDFRVQTDFGGLRAMASPTADLIAQACSILQAAAPATAYARLDAIEVQGKLVIMELELIDPVLFFSFKLDSEFILATSIQAALN